jgi:hypothetical protein
VSSLRKWLRVQYRRRSRATSIRLRSLLR